MVVLGEELLRSVRTYVALSPSDGALLRGGRTLVRLAFDTCREVDTVGEGNLSMRSEAVRLDAAGTACMGRRTEVHDVVSADGTLDAQIRATVVRTRIRQLQRDR